MCNKFSSVFRFSELKRNFVDGIKRYKKLKFRKCETPLMEPARAMVSPFPEGRDLGWG